jgi:hypothetical protein
MTAVSITDVIERCVAVDALLVVALVVTLFKFGFSGMQQCFGSGSTTLLLFSLQLAN